MEEKSNLQARLSELREKLQLFPYRKAALFKEFNNELAFGEPAKAESVRTKIQELELEGEALRLEIRKIELDLQGGEQ